MNGMRIAAAAGATALAMLTFAAPASAAARAGDICMWSQRDYKGASWCWNPGNGYVDVPPALHDNVGSFRAEAAGCFINWIRPGSQKETRVVRNGDYRRVYDNDFGGRIDAVAPRC
ncbi:peptidase inhibitor family I36 protein [Nonomuraea aridisoli]|nr:peptidase inhibitor family I36 protein [Nonomuraea aridisoli]